MYGILTAEILNRPAELNFKMVSTISNELKVLLFIFMSTGIQW